MRSTHVTVVALLAASLAGCGGRTSDHRRAPVPAPEVVEAGAGLGAWELFEPRFLTAVATHPGVSFAIAKEAYVAIVHVAPDGSLTALHPTEAGRVEARGAGEH